MNQSQIDPQTRLSTARYLAESEGNEKTTVNPQTILGGPLAPESVANYHLRRIAVGGVAGLIAIGALVGSVEAIGGALDRVDQHQQEENVKFEDRSLIGEPFSPDTDPSQVVISVDQP
jgi:hypothetical protein